MLFLMHICEYEIRLKIDTNDYCAAVCVGFLCLFKRRSFSTYESNYYFEMRTF